LKICDFTTPELEKYLELCNFTEDEKEVFILLSKGLTRVQIADRTMMSISTIGRIKLKIEKKISRL